MQHVWENSERVYIQELDDSGLIVDMRRENGYEYFVYVNKSICSGLFSEYSLVKRDQLLRKKFYPEVDFKIGKILISRFNETLKARGIKYDFDAYTIEKDPTKKALARRTAYLKKALAQKTAYLAKVRKKDAPTFEELQKKYVNKIQALKPRFVCYKPEPPTTREIATDILQPPTWPQSWWERTFNRPFTHIATWFFIIVLFVFVFYSMIMRG